MRRALVALALLACACVQRAPAFDPADVQLIVEMRDYVVETSQRTVPAGAVRIGVRNRGSQPHDLVVIRTELAPDALPYDAGRARAREDGLVAKTEEFPGGGTRRLDVTLDPGRYVLICNVPGHYQLGMRTGLLVEAR